MKKIIRRAIPDIATPLHCDPILHAVFAARAISSPQDLDNNLNYLLPFHELTGIDVAVDLLVDCLDKQDPIVVIGDFDVDGATSTVLALLALKKFGFKEVSYLIPNRFDFGYGLSPDVVQAVQERAQKNQPKLILTVDNGISSIEGVAAANAAGIKVIITDHHLAGSVLPAAAAIVNPNQPDDKFLSKNLAGVGVIFYLLVALRSRLRDSGKFAKLGIEPANMAQFLDLVALGTVADVVPLDHNNRILVQHGLERIRNDLGRCGMKSLLTISSRNCSMVTANDLGYVIGPRINAAGRLDDMSLGIECLMTESKDRAHAIAFQLEAMNRERREIEQQMQEQALRIIDNLKLDQELPAGLCVFDENWHQGVLGILASRLKDRLYRPVIAFTEVDGGELRGSARSVPDLHIRNILHTIHSQCPELILRFGGHASAAGLSLKRENYETFDETFRAEVTRQIKSTTLQSCIYTDGELPTDHFNLAFVEQLGKFGPWGQGFPEPLFDNVFEVVEQHLVGKKHLKITLRIPENRQLLDAICFNIDTKFWPNHHCRKVRAVYRLDVNRYAGRASLQLVAEYIQAV